MSLSEIISKNEKVFKGAVDLKYYFSPSSSCDKFLLVGFSGFNGKEEHGEKARYNYVKQLKDLDAHKLFILDDYENNLPCYYLGSNKRLDYETTVMSLIVMIANTYSIPMGNVITFGTSKGGTAALYFGTKYKLGHVIAGGMQTKVGDYIYNVSEFTRTKILKLITGESNEQGRDYLNNFYQEVFENPNEGTNFNIHGGSGDYHYVTYGKPFIDTLRKKNIKVNLDVRDYSDHGKIGEFFTPFLYNQVAQITGKVLISNYEVRKNKNILEATCEIPLNLEEDKSVRYAFYILKDKETQPIMKYPYNKSNKIKYEVKEPGNYRIRIYVRNDQGVCKTGTRSINFS